MNINELLSDKSIKPKEKTETLSQWIIDHPQKSNDVIEFAKAAKDPAKATCIEAFEFATKAKPEIATPELLAFVSETLAAKAPRVKWESAKVVGNIANQYPKQLNKAINNLLVNSEHEGTVVRWSAAYALGEIIKLKTSHNKMLLPAIDAICKREEKNSIRKIYFAALKKLE